MAKGYEQVIEALRRVGAEHLEEARSCFLDHSNWLATAVNKAREELLALKALNSEQVSENQDQQPAADPEGSIKQESNGARTRGRRRRGHQTLCSIQEEDEGSIHESKEHCHQLKKARTTADTGGCGKESPLQVITAAAAESGKSDEKPSKRRAPARRGRPPRLPRKADNSADDTGKGKDTECPESQSQGSKGQCHLVAREQAPGNEPKTLRRTRRKAAGSEDTPEIPVVSPPRKRQTRSRAVAASLENATETSGNADNTSAATQKPRSRKRNARNAEICPVEERDEGQSMAIEAAVAEDKADLHIGLQQVVPETNADHPGCLPAEDVLEDMKQDGGSMPLTGEPEPILHGAADADPQVIPILDGAVDADPQVTANTSSATCDCVPESADASAKMGTLTPLPAIGDEMEHHNDAEAYHIDEFAEKVNVKETEMGDGPRHSDVQFAIAVDSDPQFGSNVLPGQTSPPTLLPTLEENGCAMSEVMDNSEPASMHEEVTIMSPLPTVQVECPEGGRSSSLVHETGVDTAIDCITGHGEQQLVVAAEPSPLQELADGLITESANNVPITADSQLKPAKPSLGVAPEGGTECLQREERHSVESCVEVRASPADARVLRNSGWIQLLRQSGGPESILQSSGMGSGSLCPSEEEAVTRPSSTSLVAASLPTPETGGQDADELTCVHGIDSAAFPQPSMPVQSSRVGLGANLVSTVRSFLPFVSKNTTDSTTGVAAGKTHVKVKALEAAEALKRKEALKAAQRAKMKEEVEKQKAERNKAKQETDKESEAQRKKEMLLKKDEEAAARRKAKELAERKEREEKAKRMEQIRMKASHAFPTASNVLSQQAVGAKGEDRLGTYVGSSSTLNVKPGGILPVNKENLSAGGHDKRQYGRENSGNENGYANAGSLNSQGTAAPALPRATSDAKHSNAVQSYEMSPYRSDSSDDDSGDDERRRKPIPEWARGRVLFSQLISQSGVDPDEVFQQHSTTCSLDAVFGHADPQGGKKKDLNRRGSSGNWIEDRVTWKEEMAYKRAMGYL